MVAGLCHFVFSRQKDATRKDENTPLMRKDDKIKVSNGVFSHGVFFFFFFRLAEISFVRRVSSFRMALFPFVFSRGVLSFFFYLFVWCLFEWRLFAAKRRNGTNQPPYFIHTNRVALPHFGSLLAVTVLNLDFLPLKCQK